MAKQIVNIGSSPNDDTGDTIREGGDKINDNFTELYDRPLAPDVADQATVDAGVSNTEMITPLTF